jgi:hypothetical protein
MRTLLTLTFAIGLAAPAVGAFAQTSAQINKAGANQAPSASETLGPSLATGAPPIPAGAPNDLGHTAVTGDRANASASLPVLPSNWGGDAKSWATHVKACKAKYRNYDGGTDQYTPKGGGLTKCTLAMPK